MKALESRIFALHTGQAKAWLEEYVQRLKAARFEGLGERLRGETNRVESKREETKRAENKIAEIMKKDYRKFRDATR